jgi:protein-S-isoprenylcysteine O-methyltransferase Ste14
MTESREDGAKATADSRRFLLTRAVLAFCACPGMVAFAVPLAIARLGHRSPRRPSALVLVVCGTVLLLWCVREFYLAGRGTLAPWAPPQRLVTSGAYRLSRNPMYVAVAIILAGWSAVFGSRTLAIYTVCAVAAFWLRVRLVEEPWAARRFGADWDRYRAHTRRWL